MRASHDCTSLLSCEVHLLTTIRISAESSHGTRWDGGRANRYLLRHAKNVTASGAFECLSCSLISHCESDRAFWAGDTDGHGASKDALPEARVTGQVGEVVG